MKYVIALALGFMLHRLIRMVAYYRFKKSPTRNYFSLSRFHSWVSGDMLIYTDLVTRQEVRVSLKDFDPENLIKLDPGSSPG